MIPMITKLFAGLRGPLIWALLGAACSGFATWELRSWQSSALVSAANTAQARAEKALADMRVALADNIAEMERQRAEEQTQALNLAKAQNAKLLDLQMRLAESERERTKISVQLEEELAHASVGDARDLGPAVLRYLDRVRGEQSPR